MVDHVEKVACALAEADGLDPHLDDSGPDDPWHPAWHDYRDLARAAIAAYNPNESLREALERAVNALHYIYETSDDEHASRKAKEAHDDALPFTAPPSDLSE